MRFWFAVCIFCEMACCHYRKPVFLMMFDMQREKRIAFGLICVYNKDSRPQMGRAFRTGEWNMILVIDIGNTTVSFGGIDIDGSNAYHVRFISKMETKCEWETSECTERMLEVFREEGTSAEDYTGVVISSVVPKVFEVIYEAVRSIFGTEPLIVSDQMKLGIEIDVPEPAKVGKDRLVDSAWAAAHYPLPVITVDLGTATTLNVIRRGKQFCGGVIAAGMDTGLQALASRTAQLPKLELCIPERVIGRNTEECMISGAVAGTAAMLDGLVADIEDALGEAASLVITGGGAPYVDQLIRHSHVFDQNMILKGLAYLYFLNRENDNRI